MLPTNLNQSFNDSLLRFLWRQWSQLGVPGEIEFRDTWIIDPEALLLFTLEIGRREPRLFDEVLDWSISNGRLISIQRLKNLSKKFGDQSAEILAAFAAILDSYDPKRRWKSLRRSTSDIEVRQAFFLDNCGNELPLFGELDERFLSQGYLRGEFTPRGMSLPVPTEPISNLVFKLRCLTGLGPRVESISYLLTHESARAGQISRAAGYSQPSVTETLHDLKRSGLVHVSGKNLYSADKPRWNQFLEMDDPLPRWIDWPGVFRACTLLNGFISSAGTEDLSEYMIGSKAVTLSDELAELISGAGIRNPFVRPLKLEDAPARLAARALKLAEALGSPVSHA